MSPGVALQDASMLDSDELHRATLASIADAVFLTDDHGRFRYVCPNVNLIFGYTPGEVRALGRISSLVLDGVYLTGTSPPGVPSRGAAERGGA